MALDKLLDLWELCALSIQWGRWWHLLDRVDKDLNGRAYVNFLQEDWHLQGDSLPLSSLPTMSDASSLFQLRLSYSSLIIMMYSIFVILFSSWSTYYNVALSTILFSPLLKNRGQCHFITAEMVIHYSKIEEYFSR